MSRRWPLRGWIALWAVLQFALPAFALYADVLLERESRTAFAHAESRSNSACNPVHSAECGLCQVVQHRASLPERECVLPTTLYEAWFVRIAWDGVAPSALRGALPSSRAPPLA